jgi:hypothetical protein
MNKFNEFITKNFQGIVIGLLIVLFFRTCSGGTNKRIDRLTKEIDSLKKVSVTKKDLIIEGLKAEKRMIQSTDRKILDVNRQSVIDAELKNLEINSEK